MKFSRTAPVKLASIALAFVTVGMAATAQAQSYRYFSDGTSDAAQGIAPAPVFVQPQPYYDNSGNLVYPEGYYVQPAPQYVQQPEPVYSDSAPVYYSSPAQVFDGQGWSQEDRQRAWDGERRPEYNWGSDSLRQQNGRDRD